ncbi:MAG: hypothetical protein PHQ05_09845 [Sterolibacterium sp.]|nr:hypothetical protein [Sterolibacterium sp.]
MKPSVIRRSVFSLLLAAISVLAFSATVNASSGDGLKSQSGPRMANVAVADQFNVAGQLAAGNAAYSRGDYAEAFRLYKNIAVLGVPEAHYRLGLMYAGGLGTRQSANQAEFWMNSAAQSNYPGAAQALSLIRAMMAKG